MAQLHTLGCIERVYENTRRCFIFGRATCRRESIGLATLSWREECSVATNRNQAHEIFQRRQRLVSWSRYRKRHERPVEQRHSQGGADHKRHIEMMQPNQWVQATPDGAVSSAVAGLAFWPGVPDPDR